MLVVPVLLACATGTRVRGHGGGAVAADIAGNYAVMLCRGSCRENDTTAVLARGVIAILDHEHPELEKELRGIYRYCEGCSDSSFAHVRVCYSFTRFQRDTTNRLGPYPRGFSDLVITASGDSVTFSLGQTADAGYWAQAHIHNGIMRGSATGWGGTQPLFYSAVVNGRRVIRRATKDELARTAYPADSLLGRRVAAAGPGSCITPTQS